MSTLHVIPANIRESYEVYEWRNAAGVLMTANPDEWKDIQYALGSFNFKRSELIAGGGSKSVIAKRFDGFLTHNNRWVEKNFATMTVVDGEERKSTTHKVDCFRGRVGLETEWNTKDTFFDRDLNNFRLLFDLNIIDVGVIITRATSLHNLFRELGIIKKFGASTTHVGKLIPRLDGGGGGGCPILVFAVTDKKYIDDRTQDWKDFFHETAHPQT